MIQSLNAIHNAALPKSRLPSPAANAAPLNFANTLNSVGDPTMSAAEKVRAGFLAQHGLTQEDLNKMSPAQFQNLANQIKAGR